MSKLACGCLPGIVLCQEAQRLWAAVNAAYGAWRAKPSDEAWQEYEDALRRYGHHFAKE